MWYRMNDASVTVVNKNSVSRVNPYMLFYRKKMLPLNVEEIKKIRKNSLSRRSSHEIEVDLDKPVIEIQQMDLENLDINKIFNMKNDLKKNHKIFKEEDFDIFEKILKIRVFKIIKEF